MSAGVVIRSRDEAARLRLTLASLEGQPGLDEVVVVDDGSRDATPGVIADATARLPLVAVRNAEPLGRAGAANAGAAAAGAALLIFLDGDTLAGHGMVAAHLAAQRSSGVTIGRGETWHLRCTRFLADPEAGTFRAEEAARGVVLGEADRAALRVTRDQVRHDFAAIVARARPGIYPGAAPARLHADEMRALAAGAGPHLWAAASGSNLSVPRDAFLAAGGFDAAVDINEHRELAYRLCTRGARIVGVPDARTYHLTHRAGWRDPLEETAWEARFRAAHPAAPIDALKRYWQAIAAPGVAADFFAGA